MFKHHTVIIVLLSFIFSSCAQKEIQDYQGEWVGFLLNKKSFNFYVSLEKLEGANYHLTIANDEMLIDENLESSSKDHIQFNLDQELFFNLMSDQEGQALTGFIKTGRFFYHVNLPKTSDNKYTGSWNPFMLDNGLQSKDINLYVENTEDGKLAAYPFLGDQRSRGFWATDFKKEGDTLLFRDQNAGFNFRAELLKNTIELEILLTDAFLAKTSLRFSKDGWEYSTDDVANSDKVNMPKQLDDGWETAQIENYGIGKRNLQQLIDSINAKKLINTHSVLIAKENKLVFETYFDGFNINIPHDTRSASKSISSAIIGIAINDRIIGSVDQKLYDFIPQEYQYTKNPLKSKITIKDLLTMSSGLDVNDKAYEDYYQQSDNWLKTVLEAPLAKDPGSYTDYGSANPFLLGVSLNERLDTSLELFMEEKFFSPLGITNYVLNTDDTEEIPYFGGGMLLTPRDFLKFGQLYLNKGNWKGKQIIPESWVEESFKKYGRLQDYKDKNEYGYLWWHDTYIVNGKEIESIEARGAGGQFLSIIPELETVVVITAGNYRNRKGNQSREIFEAYILPSMVK